MSGTTEIDWTDATLNFLMWRCKGVSRGCDLCYARIQTDRYQGKGAFESGPPALKPHRLLLPWTDPKFREAYRIFAVSMSDPFHSGLPIEDLAMAWAMMAADRRHLYQVPTKRQGPAKSRLTRPDFPALMTQGFDRLEALAAGRARHLTPARRAMLTDIEAARGTVLPLPNVMLGVSAEDRHWWKIRVPVLRQIPAAARFVSVEPCLGELGEIDLRGIDWVICGGESGAGHRPMDLQWARDLRDQCADQGVAFWFKQVGGRYPKTNGDLLDGKRHKQHFAGLDLAA